MNHAILTVAGKGGVGKTSISAAIVRILVREHPDARIWPLTPIPPWVWPQPLASRCR